MWEWSHHTCVFSRSIHWNTTSLEQPGADLLLQESSCWQMQIPLTFSEALSAVHYNGNSNIFCCERLILQLRALICNLIFNHWNTWLCKGGFYVISLNEKEMQHPATCASLHFKITLCKITTIDHYLSSLPVSSDFN